jgi:hypothetical protein
MKDQRAYLADLAEISHKTWIYVIMSHNDFTWNLRTMKFILENLKEWMMASQNDTNQCCEELCDFFRKYIYIPKVQKDLQQILAVNRWAERMVFDIAV